jgi:mRNA-degrading endonuclease toxin of MazEF toxin-antitoxin module
MKRFDVCRASGFGIAGKGRLVVILQHEHFVDLDSVIVVPLYGARELPALINVRPEIKVDRQKLVAAVDRLASLPKQQLGPALTNAESVRFELLRAVDRLFSGF